jgi:hypothetical protein
LREALAALGPYFEVDRPDGYWQPLHVLLDSPGRLTERVQAVRTALGGDEVPVRVAASVAQLGLVARLLAPVFGAAVIDGRLLVLDDASWRPAVGGPMPLALPDTALGGVPYDSLVVGIGERVLSGPVLALVDLTAGLSVSPKVLWGNVASAINGAATMVARARPDLDVRSQLLAGRLLDLPVLRGSATGVPGVDFRRRSCCLLYRLGPATPKAVCGDCVIVGVNPGFPGQ